MQLTELERMALEGILKSQYQTDKPIGNRVPLWSCRTLFKDIPQGIFKFNGVIGSCVRKGYVKYHGEGLKAALAITELGYKRVMGSNHVPPKSKT